MPGVATRDEVDENDPKGPDVGDGGDERSSALW